MEIHCDARVCDVKHTRSQITLNAPFKADSGNLMDKWHFDASHFLLVDRRVGAAAIEEAAVVAVAVIITPDDLAKVVDAVGKGVCAPSGLSSVV
jgi:hypothetical protein